MNLKGESLAYFSKAKRKGWLIPIDGSAIFKAAITLLCVESDHESLEFEVLIWIVEDSRRALLDFLTGASHS